MADVKQQLTRVDELAQKLINEYSACKKDAANLQQQVSKLNHELKQKNQELQMLEHELKNVRVAQGMTTDGGDAEQARAKISALVREIDRCIALLNE